MKLKDASDAVLIAAYIKIRDARAQRRAEYEKADAEDRLKQEKIEAEMLSRMNSREARAISSKYGTAYVTSRVSVTVGDWDALFKGYILPNGAWELLERRVNKTAVMQYRNEHNDLPPGVNWSEEAVVNFRRS